MKKHITVDQLNELSEKGKEKFRDVFWRISDGDLLIYGDYNGKLGNKIIVFNYGMIPADEEEFGYKLLSIGQMIEFLDENKLIHTIWTIKEKDIWKVYIPNGSNVPTKKYNEYSNVEICDSLFEAVKEVLNK